MTKKIHRLFLSRWGRLVLSAVFVAAVFLLIRASYVITFLNNDDTNILHTLSGDFTGAPYTTHPFINILLGTVVSGLYTLMPGLYWWPLMHLAGMYLGCVAITAALIKGFRHRGLPMWMPFSVSLLFIISFYAYALVQMTFTLTSAILGTGALALILTFGMDSRDTYKPFWAVTVILFFVGAAFVFRNSSGISLLPFYALALIYRFLTIPGDVMDSRRKKSKRLVLTIAALTAIVAVLVSAVNSWGILRMNGQNFVDFDRARGRFMDYPHDTYEENPELYESVGWDENLYEMAECRFFMDGRISAEALNTIMDGSSFYRLSFGARLMEAAKLGVKTVRGNGQIGYTLTLMLLILLVAGLGYYRRGNHVPFLTVCCFALGGFFICFYLCYTGRFPLRTYLLAAYPTAVGMLLPCLKIVEPRCALSAALTRRSREINLAVTGVCFALALIVCGKTFGALDSIDTANTLRASRELNSYVMEHPTKVYIRSPLTGYDIDPYVVNISKKPSNLMDWGGTGMYTGFQRRQLESNDLSSFSPEIFKREDVFFVSTVENHQARHFENYMVANWGATGLEEVERITSYLVVYRVVFPE